MSSCTSLYRNKSRVQSSGGIATFSAWRKYAAHGGGAVVQVGLHCKNSLSSRSHVRISSAAARMTKANCEVWTGVGLRSCWSSRTRGHFSKRPHDDGQLSSERRTFIRPLLNCSGELTRTMRSKTSKWFNNLSFGPLVRLQRQQNWFSKWASKMDVMSIPKDDDDGQLSF